MSKEQPVNIKAIGWTVGVHALLLLLFIFLSYTVPASAPVEELGMEVNLGTSDNGSGTDQPMALDAPAESALSAVNRTASEKAEASKDIMTSDDPDAPAVNNTNTGTKTNQYNPQQNINTPQRPNAQNANATANQQPQRPRYVYNGSNGPGGNSATSNQPGGNEGNTSGPGDRGVPGGTPGAANYTGSPGNGTGGISHTLTGRDISPRQFVAEFNEGGKVVVRVKVDRNGAIISKTIKSSPNRTLSNIALQKLSQAKFSSNPDAAPEQIGDVTFIFKTRSQ